MKPDCAECESPRPCPHCGEDMVCHDFFGLHWCEELYWGISAFKELEALEEGQ